MEGHVRLSYRQQELHYDIRINPSVFVDYDARYRESGISTFNDWKLSADNSLQFGLEYRRLDPDYGDSEVNGGAGVDAITGFEIQDEFAAYLQLDHGFNDDLEFVGGLRFDSLSGIGSHFSPRLALLYHITAEQTIKFLYGEAFKTPNFNELFSESFLLVGNPDLEPELVKSFDLIWVGEFDKVHLQLGYFYSIVSDSISETVSGGQRTFANTAGDESFSGLEAEARYFFNENWSLRAGGSHFFNQENHAFREAEYLAFAAVNYQKRKFNVNLSANYMGSKERLEQGSTELVDLDGYFDINAKVLYYYSDDWEFFVQGKNLLNQHFKTPAQGALENGVPNRGLEMSFGVKWKF